MRRVPWGRRIEVADAWVAATALLYDAPLVTDNPGDYVGVAGIELRPNEPFRASRGLESGAW